MASTKKILADFKLALKDKDYSLAKKQRGEMIIFLGEVRQFCFMEDLNRKITKDTGFRSIDNFG